MQSPPVGNGLNTPGQTQKDSLNQARQEYEFFVSTGQSSLPDGASRVLIRRLVMRNFFEHKASSAAKPKSEINSTSAVEAGQKLKGRFRLPKVGQPGSPDKPKGAGKKSARRASKETTRPRVPKLSRNQSSKSSASNNTDDGTTGILSGGSLGCAPSQEAGLRPLLRRNPRTHRFDPFDVLPIPGSDRLDMLFRLYKSGFRINSLAVNARNTWWPFICCDAALLHATLASVALYGVLSRNLVEMRVETLRHKNEAIRGINAKINDPNEGISDELVGAVTTLASFENICGAYDAAQLHITALKRMLETRGGLLAFEHNDGLKRGIIWVDFHTAAAFRTPPAFSQVRCSPNIPTLPDAFLEEAAFSSPTSLLHLPLAAVECFNIFYRLHRLGLATSSYWSHEVDRLAVSEMLYETEYALLSIPDRTMAFIEWDRKHKGEVEILEEDEEVSVAADAASMVEALVAAGQIFLYGALREVPPRAKIYELLLNRLRATLNRPNIDTVALWERERNLNTLLWALVVGAAVSGHWGEKDGWFLSIAEVVQTLNILDRNELKNVLQGVAWTDIFFDGVIDEVWSDVVGLLENQSRLRVEDMVQEEVNYGTLELR